MRIFHELSERLPDDAIVAADSGSAANWYARHLRFRGDMRGSLSGTLATMGPGVPYVIGAKWAHPDRPAIALVGDGAMQMNGMAELITDRPLLAAVGRPAADRRGPAQQRPQPGDVGDARDGGRAEVRRVADAARTSTTRRSRAASGWPASMSTTPTTSAPPGIDALAADRPDRPRRALRPERRRRSRRTRPSSRSRPLASSLMHGDADAWGVVKQGVKQKAQQYLPGTKGDE